MEKNKQIFGRIAKLAFTPAVTKPIVDNKETSAKPGGKIKLLMQNSIKQ